MSHFVRKAVTALSLLCLSTLALADVSISEPYARAVPPGQANSAIFMQLSNSSDHEISLISAQSTVAKAVELHTHKHENGVMQMRKVELIPVPAKGETHLEPGGYHIMLIGLNKGLADGDVISLELRFSDGKRLQLRVPVLKITEHTHQHHKH